MVSIKSLKLQTHVNIPRRELRRLSIVIAIPYREGRVMTAGLHTYATAHIYAFVCITSIYIHSHRTGICAVRRASRLSHSRYDRAGFTTTENHTAPNINRNYGAIHI